MAGEVLAIETRAIEETAQKYFIKMCGFDITKDRHRKMMDEAMTLHATLAPGLNIQALVVPLDITDLEGPVMTLNGVPVLCQAFDQLDAEDLVRAYGYIVTTGPVPVDEDDDSMLGMLYADGWGTCYAEAANDMVKAHVVSLAEQEGLYASPAFGPGYYGMPMEEMHNIFKLLDGDKVGVGVTQSGLMLPPKSCAGFFILTTDPEKLPQNACHDCVGNKKGCMYCNVRTQRPICT